jgi:hypothetical protein
MICLYFDFSVQAEMTVELPFNKMTERHDQRPKNGIVAVLAASVRAIHTPSSTL